MKKINAYVIQENLRPKRFISIPDIQSEYELDYREASEFLQHLMLRNWVEKKEDLHRGYMIIRSNLRLRHISRAEVDELIEDIDHYCTAVLSSISRRGSRGASFDEVASDLKSATKTSVAMEILIKHYMIYEAGDQYFNCVSDKVVEALEKVAEARHMLAIKEQIDFSPEEREKLKRMLEKLCVD